MGAEEVGRYAKSKNQGGDDVEKWQFFFGLNSADEFDFCQQTADWIARYKDEILIDCTDILQ